VFNKIFAALAHRGRNPERVMIDATHLKAHRTAASLSAICIAAAVIFWL
jgi:putative transposase